MAIKLSLGPVSYFWPKQKLLDFYQDIEKSCIDIVYLGEVVCSKRQEMQYQDWMDLAHRLQHKGKVVVLSTMTLIEANSERSRMRRFCEQDDFMVEANDFGAIEMLSQQNKAFTTGSSINIYNQSSLNLLHKQGLIRWNLSVELGKKQLKILQHNRPKDLQTEVMVWGKIPLAYSARCFTARAHNLPKDKCQFKCIDDPDGLVMKTRESQEFLCLNGIQTQSTLTNNLMTELDTMENLGVNVIRINPQSQHTVEIIDAFSNVLTNKQPANDYLSKFENFAPSGLCNGYWFGKAGMSTDNIPLKQVEST